MDCGGSCVSCCEDGLLNGNETGVDCGGICGPCATKMQPFPYLPVLIPLAAVLLCAGCAFLWWRCVATPRLMISYRHQDSAFAFKLETDLRRAGFIVWIDRQINGASDWRDNIAEAIQNATAVVCIITPLSVTSKYCHVASAVVLSRSTPPSVPRPLPR